MRTVLRTQQNVTYGATYSDVCNMHVARAVCEADGLSQGHGLCSNIIDRFTIYNSC